MLKKDFYTPIMLREPDNPDSYDIAPDATLHVVTAGWCVATKR
eukprot:COSAG06_NODE_12471_length_1376_cov_7.936570_2_plen_43_part_00